MAFIEAERALSLKIITTKRILLMEHNYISCCKILKPVVLVV